ncbi:MAG: hypothetical protein ACP5QG_06615 [candidate division WOR-3 bacterium]
MKRIEEVSVVIRFTEADEGESPLDVLLRVLGKFNSAYRVALGQIIKELAELVPLRILKRTGQLRSACPHLHPFRRNVKVNGSAEIDKRTNRILRFHIEAIVPETEISPWEGKENLEPTDFKRFENLGLLILSP